MLEKHTQTKWQIYWKEQVANWYGMFLHEAQYLEPVMRDIEAMLVSSQRNVTGTVELILRPYSYTLVGVDSTYDLMKTDFGEYGEVNKAWTADDVKGFYKLVGGRAGVTEYYMYDATNIRLRELAVSYALPQKLVRRTRVLSGVTLSLVARNLFFIYNAAPFDPDLILSTGNDNQGIEVYGMPTVRSVGFNIKLEF